MFKEFELTIKENTPWNEGLIKTFKLQEFREVLEDKTFNQVKENVAELIKGRLGTKIVYMDSPEEGINFLVTKIVKPDGEEIGFTYDMTCTPLMVETKDFIKRFLIERRTGKLYKIVFEKKRELPKELIDGLGEVFSIPHMEDFMIIFEEFGGVVINPGEEDPYQIDF